MITVTKLVVRTFSVDFLDIFWEIPETSEEIERYDFFVLRSIDGPVGPFEKIAGPFYNTFTFRDGGVNVLNRWRNYFYKIRVVKRGTEEVHEFGPEWLRAMPDLLGLEFQRREQMLFKQLAGRLSFLYPALTFGQRCPHCWDVGPKGNTIGRSTTQNCLTCFDTTFVGGFATPMGFYIQIDPSPKSVQKTDLEEHQFSVTTARTTAFPPIKAKDVIVEAENKRWLVQKVTGTEKLRAVVRQELELWELSKDDVKFRIPIDYDLLADHSPASAFRRPMSLQTEQVVPVKDLLEPE